jgi:hypothetical protein
MSGERSGEEKGLSMASGDALNILDGYSWSNIFIAVQVQKVGSTYQAQIKARDDAGPGAIPTSTGYVIGAKASASYSQLNYNLLGTIP